MDAIDQKIIELLQSDGRLSKRAIARTLGTSENMIRKRLKRIEDQGIARHGLIVDMTVLGLTSAAWFFVTAESDHVEEIAHTLAADAAVTLVSLVTGRHDIVCYVVGASDRDIDAFVQRQIDRFDGILHSTVRPVRKTELYRYELISLPHASEPPPED